MIHIDPRDPGRGELQHYIRRLNVPVEVTQLESGDAAFEGNGPEGRRVLVGVERKKLNDMLNCIDDARYAGHQRIKMMQDYRTSILIIEGVWKPDFSNGYLLECVQQLTWRPLRYRQQMTRYNKLFRYLLSVSLSGVIVLRTRDIEHTAFDIVECYQWWQKKWEDHTALLEVPKIALPTLNGKPSLTLRWAVDIDDIGIKFGAEAEGMFRSPLRLAASEPDEWQRIRGIGKATALKVIRQIRGLE